jgi:hypothetical protein
MQGNITHPLINFQLALKETVTKKYSSLVDLVVVKNISYVKLCSVHTNSIYQL